MDAMRTCLRFSLAAAIGAMVAILLVGCGMGEVGTSSSTPGLTASPSAGAEPTSTPETMAGVPSGSLVFLVAQGYSSNLYLVNSDGSGLTELTDSTENDTPGGFSPNGTLIAYTSMLRDDGNAPGVYVMSPDGSNPHIVAGGAGDSFVSWSSRGRILYYSSVTGVGDYWIINPDGSDRTRISQMNLCSDAVDWSPDGENLVLCQCTSSPDNALPCSLSIIDQQGNLIRTLLQNDTAIPHSPKWSPDGKQILFTSQKEAGGPGTVLVMGADGASARSLYQSPASAIWTEAKWSPDGSQIAVMTSTQIAVVSPVDGTSHVVASGKDIFSFAWSPKGGEIAYDSEDGGYKVYMVGSEGGEPRVVADPATGPVWSPDGKQILFASNRARQEGVWWASPDGSKRGRLAALSAEFVPPAEPTVEGVIGGCTKGPDEFSCLSPDGRSEAIALTNGNVLQIKDLATGVTRSIMTTEVNFWNTSPVWSNDGTKIALSAPGPPSPLYVVDAATGAAKAIAAGLGSGGFDPTIAWSPDDSYVYYVKGTVCREGCAPGFLYRVHPDGTREERVVDMRIGLVYGFKP
jgi:Tol biopolymer transport system component